jgi:hypothetical protein
MEKKPVYHTTQCLGRKSDTCIPCYSVNHPIARLPGSTAVRVYPPTRAKADPGRDLTHFRPEPGRAKGAGAARDGSSSGRLACTTNWRQERSTGQEKLDSRRVIGPNNDTV